MSCLTKPVDVVSKSDYDALSNYRDWAETRRAKDHARIVKLEMQLQSMLGRCSHEIHSEISDLLGEDYLGSFKLSVCQTCGDVKVGQDSACPDCSVPQRVSEHE